MQRIDIPFDRFVIAPLKAWDKDWLLLAAGDLASGDWNCMTVAWGSFGVIWAKPLAIVFVRPTRYTLRFADKHPTFTLSAFPERYRDALTFCGSHSGRDTDKMKGSGLTPEAARMVAAPAFAEAHLVVECRKTYFDDLERRQFLAPWIEANYPQKDYHRMYFGEIVAISGDAAFHAKE